MFSDAEAFLLSCVLRCTAVLLHFPARATITACTLYRRYLKHTDQLPHGDSPVLVAACILLASKIEEVPVSNNHLLNVSHLLYGLLQTGKANIQDLMGCKGSNALQQAATIATNTTNPVKELPPAPKQPDPQPAPHSGPITAPSESSYQTSAMNDQQSILNSDGKDNGSTAGNDHMVLSPVLLKALQDSRVIVGDHYYSVKAQMLEAEQQVLRLSQFCLSTCQPTTALLHAAAALQLPAKLLTASLAMLNDAAAFTDTLLLSAPMTFSRAGTSQETGFVSFGITAQHQHQHEVVVALACIFLASALLGKHDDDCSIMCMSCRHLRSQVESACIHDNQSNTDRDVAVNPQRSTPCIHWISVLGVDVGRVIDVAHALHTALAAAYKALELAAEDTG